MMQKITWAVGIVLVLVGILGFAPVVTNNGLLLGIFQVDMMHNLVHLLTGILAIAAAWMGSYMRFYFKVFGVVYAIVAILGFAFGDNVLGMMMNMPDHVLHVVIAAVFLWLGFGMKEIAAPMMASPAPSAGMSM